MSNLNEKIKLLPKSSGVYVMLDKDNTVIYVGKAKNLKNRVTQYFRNGFKTEKVSKMVINIVDFYYIITHTEADALTLENNLIKKYKPKYNILLKDDKSYPYIKINLKEKYPTFKVTRTFKKDGAKYFGPFMLGVKVDEVLSIIKEVYKVRPCQKTNIGYKVQKECLNYHLGLCLSPCSQKCTEKEYKQEVIKAVEFLKGDDKTPEKILTYKMQKAVENQEFESAIILRERLKMLEKLKQKKITALNNDLTCDVIAIQSDGIFSAINVLFIRSGRMLGAKSFAVETLADNDSERISAFLMQYYNSKKELPDQILLSQNIENKEQIEKELFKIHERKVEILVPIKSLKKSLVEMAEKNAVDYLEKQINVIKHKNDMTYIACSHLKEILSLKNFPKRIECYDISHISGELKVGSMVVFINGESAKTEYRRFKIKTVEGNNDFASLKEVLSRRLDYLGTAEEEKFLKPDLIVIDGGKGQLSSVLEVFNEKGVDVDVISLAEREEEIFLPNKKEPIILSKKDYSLRLLQRIRDEAHRFAITYNKNLRVKKNLASLLENIKGIGKSKRNALMDKFKDINGIISATKEELMQVDGIGEKQALLIKEFFKNERN